MFKKSIKTVAITAALTASLSLAFLGSADAKVNGKWLSGDFHQHTFYTDGGTTFDFVMEKNNEYGLDWWANSEHGGSRYYDGDKVFWDDYTVYPEGTILGDVKYSNGHQVMYRWQSLRDFVWKDILEARETYSDKKIASGVEWNVPNHEHCSVGVIAEDATAISAFEFQFDKSDSDMSRVDEITPYGTLVKTNKTHEDSVAGCAWMQEQLDEGRINDAWIIFAHIERNGAWSTGGYDIENFRDYNNAAPDVCFGFEGIPGHQPSNGGRGGFDSEASGGGTYGGAGYYTATIGGLWDALLGEGRRWFIFANSDYHSYGGDFYPGQYQKTWSYVIDADNDGDYSLKETAESLRSGNSFNTMGDIIDALEFEAQNNKDKIAMGGEMHADGTIKNLKIKIKFRSPAVNNNGDVPVVDHIDLIAGTITGIVEPGTPEYSQINSDAKVIARFTAADWETDEDGYNVIVYHVKNLDKNTYYRLRGTNLPVGTPGQSDELGNPTLDLDGPLKGAEETWTDMWFYSNPIFVYVD